MKTKQLLIAPLLSCLFATAHAATVSYSFDTIFSDAPVPPDASGPWLQMTTTDTGINQVSLTFSALALTAPEYVKWWYINVDPSLNISLLSFSVNSVIGDFVNPIPQGYMMFTSRSVRALGMAASRDSPMAIRSPTRSPTAVPARLILPPSRSSALPTVKRRMAPTPLRRSFRPLVLAMPVARGLPRSRSHP
jgi:hypothetical protein